MSMKKRKAVALISGGLDSMLAAKVVLEQGIHVEGLNFYSGFFGVGSKVVELNKKSAKPNFNSAAWITEQLGIKLHVINVVTEFKEVFLNPKYGYGANINPCLDCKIFIVKYALQWIKKYGFDFVVTGEVIGQRPMSQRKDTMSIVKRDTQANGLLLRPLCAKNLLPTIPEEKGWVDREKLLNFSGRSRKPQIALAKQYGFENIPQPAGGCLLTEARYAARLTDLWETAGVRDYTLRDIDLLKVGRYLRPRAHFKMIVGREECENEFLAKYKDEFLHFNCISHPGSLVLIVGQLSDDDIKLAVRIAARFTQGRNAEKVIMQINPQNKNSYQIAVQPMPEHEIMQEWYL